MTYKPVKLVSPSNVCDEVQALRERVAFLERCVFEGMTAEQVREVMEETEREYGMGEGQQ